MFGNPMEIAIVVGAAVLLFGGNKIRDVARSLGAAKKEFEVGQSEADINAARAKAAAAAAAAAAAVETPVIADPHPNVESKA
jgi:TatA/E family protein of Tat protein translocase